MHAINLFTLTRAASNPASFSRFLQALSGRDDRKHVSVHEASSLCALVRKLELWFDSHLVSSNLPNPSDLLVHTKQHENWVRILDGFWFSYAIAHISKEFDLLKFSADASSVLNIELKSEDVTEDRIHTQLEQNRYYLSNVSRTIYSFTFVMETDTLYQLKENGHFGKVSVNALADVVMKSRFQTYIAENLDQYFRASDYLISPVSAPERLLQGKYFLTNQQWEFRRRILNLIREHEESRSTSPCAAPVITLTGSAGTGKTLLLFDLAIELSKKKEILFLHGGPLREGHHIINQRLRNVTILSGTEFVPEGFKPEKHLLDSSTTGFGKPGRYTCILIDEANRLSAELLSSLLDTAKSQQIPCVLAYDPYSIRSIFSAMEDAEDVIASAKTSAFAFSGNIRINRPIFSFMRNLFSLKEKTESADYSCIDVLCAENTRDEKLLAEYYLAQGYTQIRLSSEPASAFASSSDLASSADLASSDLASSSTLTSPSALASPSDLTSSSALASPSDLASSAAPAYFTEEEIVAQEYDRVLVIMDSTFYYDDDLHLCKQGEATNALAVLYEALTRTREKLALLITDNEEVFNQVLQIRTGGM